MIAHYLKVASCDFENFSYEVNDKIKISLEDAAVEYERLLRKNSIKLKDEGYHFTLSGGIDSSLMFVFGNPDSATCCHVAGNKDYGFAKRLYPEVIKDENIVETSIEELLIKTQKMWDKPHCRRGDFYDYYIYNYLGHDKTAVAEHINHVNYMNFLRKANKKRLRMFLDHAEMFTDDEIREFGYEPPVNLGLQSNNFMDFVAFVEAWTKITRKIYYRTDHVQSPFLMDNIVSFHRSLPLEMKSGKAIIKEVARRNLPSFIANRKKAVYQYQELNPVYAKNKGWELEYMKKKYLLDPERKIFDVLPYEVVRKHLNVFRKYWTLLNLAIWLELNK